MILETVQYTAMRRSRCGLRGIEAFRSTNGTKIREGMTSELVK
jgi:hypothetical protein